MKRILTAEKDSRTDYLTGDGKIRIQTTQDHTRLMEWNKAARNMRSSFNPGDDHTLAAVVPLNLLAQFAQQRGVSIHEAMNDDTIIAACIAANPDCKSIDKWVF